MAPVVAVATFLVSLAITLGAAELFAARLDRLGTRFGLSEALVGLLTALAADGPEISSALVALAKGAHTVSVGVLVGSNVFNLAAMVGVSALVAGAVRLPRESLVLEGSVGLLVTLVGSAVLLGAIGPAIGAVLCAAVLLPYLFAVIGGPERLGRLNLGGRAAEVVRRAVDERERIPAPRATSTAHPAREVLLMVGEVLLIVGGSFGMVHAVISLGDRWDISGAVIGVLILAPLTSLPNAFTALRLGRHGRGSALVTETFNSNTINLLFGIVVPGILVGIASVSTTGKVNVAWMVAMTLISVALLARRRGVGRASGVLLVGLYAGFVVTQLALG